MLFLRILLLAIVGLSAGCERDSRALAEERLRRVGVDRVRQDAALLYKDNFATRTLDFITVRSNRWPESFRALSPVRVGLYLDGVTITIEGRTTGEAGLYIIPKSMDQVPKDGPGTHFDPIVEGVYWFTFEG